MKFLITITILLSFTSCSSLKWTDVFSQTNAQGCVAGMAGGYLSSSGDTTERLQVASIGCAVGGLVTHMIRQSAKSEIKRDYEERISELKRKQDLLIKLDGYDSSQEALKRGLYIEDEVIPASINSDGSIDRESVRFRLKKIHSNEILGN